MEDITAFTTSIRCRVIDGEAYNAERKDYFYIDIPEGSTQKGKDIGGFRIPLSVEDGHRIEQFIKLRRVKDTSQLFIELEDDGYIKFSIKR